MLRPQHYYYEDITFQLELNLQFIRRDLVRLLDEYQFHDCFICNRLKCCCLYSSQSSIRSTTLSINSNHSNECYEYAINEEYILHGYYKVAPPPEALPTPAWSEKGKSPDFFDSNSDISIEAWIRASVPNEQKAKKFPLPSKVLDDINFSWPPFPMSVWSREKGRDTSKKELVLSTESERESNNNSVEAFFSYFKDVAKKAGCTI